MATFIDRLLGTSHLLSTQSQIVQTIDDAKFHVSFGYVFFVFSVPFLNGNYEIIVPNLCISFHEIVSNYAMADESKNAFWPSLCSSARFCLILMELNVMNEFTGNGMLTALLAAAKFHSGQSLPLPFGSNYSAN